MNVSHVGAWLCTLLVTAATGWLDPRDLKGAGQPDTLKSTIVFSSTRDNAPAVPPFLSGGEIYLMMGDGSGVRRLTNNEVADIFPVLSPDGTRIIFESNRQRTTNDPHNVSDLFVMNTDGTDQRWIGRGGGATWTSDRVSRVRLGNGPAGDAVSRIGHGGQ